MMAEVVLGTSNAFAARNWPEPEAWTQIIARDLGLREVQFSFDLLPPTLPEPSRSSACHDITEAVWMHNLSLRTTFTGLIAYAQNYLAHPHPSIRSYAWDWYADALAVSHMLGAEASGGHIGAMSLRDSARPHRRAFLRLHMIEMVQALTRVAAGLGQAYFLWELMPTPQEIPHTPGEAIELLAEVNDGAAVPVRLCFDVGHCLVGDSGEPGDPYRWLEALLPYSPVLHLQQTDGKADRHWPFSPEYAVAGIIEPRRIVEIVKSSPLERVDLLLELAHAFDTPAEKILDDHRRSVEVWMKWL